MDLEFELSNSTNSKFLWDGKGFKTPMDSLQGFLSLYPVPSVSELHFGVMSVTSNHD
jgi:hypothetical protein